MPKIDKKIVSYRVKTENPPAVYIGMHEGVKRSDKLLGVTYKIKTPKSDHALYVTINNIEIEGVQYPFEIFISSKNMDQFQWIIAITRVMSATFRKGGDVSFLVEEMKSVFDPAGGYFKKGGRYMNSTVAEIGYIIEEHLNEIHKTT